MTPSPRIPSADVHQPGQPASGAQRFIVMKYKSILPTCMIPEPVDLMGADSYAYTSLKYAGVVAEP